MYNYSPNSLHRHALWILPYDDSTINALTAEAYENYLGTDENYSRVDWRHRQDPTNHWCVPMVTGHKYRMYWGNDRHLDFERMRFEVTRYLWDPDN